MTNPSPICLVNATATTDGVDVTASSTVTIALADTAGVRQWNLSCLYTDEENTAAAINATLSINLTNKTATFTAPSTLGSALIFQSIINGGVDLNGVAQSSYTATFKVNVLTANSKRVLAFNETLENNASYGWMPVINEIIREDAAIVAGAGLTQSGSTINVGQNADNSITVNANDIQLSTTVAGPGLSISAGVLRIGQNADNSITVSADDIKLSSTVAGTGLSYSAGVVSIPSAIAGAGLTYSSGVVNVVANADASIVVNANDIQLKAAYQNLLDNATSSNSGGALCLRSGAGAISLADGSGTSTYGGSIAILAGTTFGIVQAARTTDVATQDMTITTQTPFAASTGSNRMPGDFILSVPAAAGALATTNSGNIRFDFGGVPAVQFYQVPSSGVGVIEFPDDGTITNVLSMSSQSTFGLFINSTCSIYGTPVDVVSTGDIDLQADNVITLNGGGGVNIDDTGGAGINITSGGGSVIISASGFSLDTGIQFEASPGSVYSIAPNNSGTNAITGTTVLIQGSNETGTTTLGGDVVLAGGTGTTRNGNVGIGQTSAGGGGGVFCIKNATTVPVSNPSGGGILFVESGALKYRGSSGTVTTIAVA